MCPNKRVLKRMYQVIQKVSLNTCVIPRNDSPIGQRLIFFLKIDLENFLPIAGLLSLPCYSFYNSPRCAAKMTLVILLPSPICSQNLWGLRSGAKVYFLPGFLAEQKPRLVNGNKTHKTGRWYVLWGGHLPPRPQNSRTQSASTGVGQRPLTT